MRYFVGFQLGVATRNDDGCARVAAYDAAYGLAAFLVSELSNGTSIDDAEVGSLAVGGAMYAPFFQETAYGRGLGEVEFAA